MPARIIPKRVVRLYIAEWREHHGLKQQQLAEHLGLTKGTISRWEARLGQPNLATQEAIAEALDVDAMDLRRHPDRPSADALLWDQPQEIIDLALKYIVAIRR